MSTRNEHNLDNDEKSVNSVTFKKFLKVVKMDKGENQKFRS